MEAKVRRIGSGYGILIPKKTLEELSINENDTIVIRRIEKPVKEIRGILKDTGYKFERAKEKEHDIGC